MSVRPHERRHLRGALHMESVLAPDPLASLPP